MSCIILTMLQSVSAFPKCPYCKKRERTIAMIRAAIEREPVRKAELQFTVTALVIVGPVSLMHVLPSPAPVPETPLIVGQFGLKFALTVAWPLLHDTLP